MFLFHYSAQENWKKLTSFLSGQFCASINLIKPTVTIRPKISFRPFLQQSDKNIQTAQEYGYLAALPQEAICTENLTPWTKLLPCQNKKGLGTLLVATNIFNSKFVSLSLDSTFSCSVCISVRLIPSYLIISLQDITRCSSTPGIELTQSILVVFDAPSALDGRYSWTLNSLFNSPLLSYCPLSSSSHVYVEVSHLDSVSNISQLSVEPSNYVCFSSVGEKFKVDFEKTLSGPLHSDAIYADYDFKQMFEDMWQNDTNGKRQSINIGIQYSNEVANQQPHTGFSDVQVRRHSRGYGVSSGGISVTITNNLSTEIYAIYLDMIPWYFRMYLYTMVIDYRPIDNLKEGFRQIKPTWLHYEPAQDRIRPHHLEMLLRLPSKSQIEIRFEFENQFLRWTEYPPDANHGLYISPASVTFFLQSNNTTNFERFSPHLLSLVGNRTLGQDFGTTLDLLQKFYPLRLYTEPILISMPTPDFSMPYNVVCLVSTVLSIAFGPIYNLTTRRTALIRKQVDDKMQRNETNENTRKKRKCLIM